ncbi:osmosensitive K+ channel signal transduction histidine kinase [Azorhizobium caulinodans ORS 571]|uniref:histidine kinase n=1 Tax=Azorhizobium caulinodans (strain ATCC 43989 / DSM 5975 / JCM 20966 / LMG 6465 / NBRC 14845 / NCIMB 13405 / ORS 571) TaxID=438753 RepID=A8HY24_AZOC5|nr:sensor histidine kinase KdpD [Azorhizobium caulinodans]BAF87566.1 osmosensitive K+ channel signal transduction histidine kinase [Azorhizobium caulinodans ORS 571]
MGQEDKPRASPDALLAMVEREGKGKLRVFLGAAPGVGKTYAMLQAARAAKADGLDVVVGIVETHGRRETEAMLEGLPVLPRRPIHYRGRLVPEFDIEGALARRPKLLLVDEYAHSNVPGSRHPKRWQDVEDLLDAGIDVWTTLNIQHLESLNEVVQRITGVRVRETVPDTAIQEADEVVMVDLPPDELLKRLAEGRVYVQDTAARAIERFFKPTNLTALRELALRRVAARVDSDLIEHMQGGAIEGPWAAGERILVCVGPDASAQKVVREAKRLADLADAPWLAVTVERPGHPLDATARARADAALRLAESLGAETRALVGSDLVEELLKVARFENVTQIVVARARPSRLSRPFVRTLADALVREADGIAVHVLTFEEGERSAPRRRLPPVGGLDGYVAAAMAVSIATLLGEELTKHVALPNVSMIFLLAVLIPALFFGVWPAVFASLFSALAYNFFFIDPVYTFTIARPHEVLALVIFLVIAVIISAVAGRAREQAKASAQRVKAGRRLYDFTRKLSSLADAPEVAAGAASEIHAILSRAAVILSSTRGELHIAAAWPPEDRLDTASLSAARWAYEHGEPAGARTATLPSVPWLFIPLKARQGIIGVIGIEALSGEPLDAEGRVLLDALADQTASALERAALAGEMADVRSAAEAERVRNILLASISHDFRTPLSSILGASSSLIEYGARIDPEQRRDLLSQIREEADHLDSMVRNLLSMTRLEAGALDLRRDWVDVGEVVNQSVAAARRRGAIQHLTVRLGENLPLVRADQILLNQVLANIVGNAVRYAGASASIEVSAERVGDEVEIAVTDSGPGIPSGLLGHVFEKFVRAASDRADGGEGAGLGLAIAKGIVEAHGGTITAESPPPGRASGLRLAFRLPVEPDTGP